MDSIISLHISDKQGRLFSVQEIHPEDSWNLCNFIVSNEHRFGTFFPKTRAANLTPDLSKRFVEVKVKEFANKEEFLFTLKPKDSHKIIGLIYVKELDWEKKKAELAYCIDYNYEGQGITSLLTQKITKLCFDMFGFETIQIITHKSNISSVRVAEKNNFVWVKTLNKSFTPPGKEALDMELYERYSDNK